MGNVNYRQITAQGSQDPRPYLQNDLPKFIYQERIGNGKFMKSYLMKVDDTSVIVKVYFKSPEEELETYAATLTWMWNALSPSQHPNLLPYQMWIKSSAKVSKPNFSPVFLVRQYFPSNLYDRLSTRPFLSDLEKLWVIYQLMRAVEEAHEEGVVHGDIKPENVMVTSWNWIVLTDFAPYKPVLIPDDDPTDFHYFFDSMGRRRCYVAPERFYKSTFTNSEPTEDVNETIGEAKASSSNNRAADPTSADILRASMDVFSLGCTMAEVLLDGEPLLDLPSMLKYKACCEDSSTGPVGSFGSKDSQIPLMTSLSDPESPALSTLNRIQDDRIRETITRMTQHSPDRRMPVKSYRGDLETSGVFPKYFGSTLYDLFLSIHWKGATPDDRVGLICQNFPSIMEHLADCEDKEGNQFFVTAMQKFAPHSSNVQIDEPIASVTDIDSARKRKSDDSETSKPLKSTKILPEARNASEQISTAVPSQRGSDNKKSSDRAITELIDQFERILDEARGRSKTSDLTTESSSAPPQDKKDPQLAVGLRTYHSRVLEARGVGLKLFEVDPDEGLQSDLHTSTSLSSYAGRSEEIHQENVSRSLRRSADSSGLILVIQIICSSIRHLRCPQSKVISLMLLTRFGVLLNDSMILQRVVPFVMLCIEDHIAIVRATSIRCLRSLLSAVTEVSQIDSSIFKDFLFPTLNNVIARDNEAIVRVAFAESIGRFAETSMRFLDASRFNTQIKLAPSPAPIPAAAAAIGTGESGGGAGEGEGEMTSSSPATAVTAAAAPVFVEGSYDTQVNVLHDQVSKWIRDLVLDGNLVSNDRSDGRSRSAGNSHSSVVKRAILEDIVRLCVFFGKQERIMDLFAQLLAYVNHTDWDIDWELRHAFCVKIPLVCAFLGSSVTSECILPFLEKARVDLHEMVVSAAVRCVWTLIEMSLLTKPMIVETMAKTVPLLVHPSVSIRQNTIGMIAAAAQYFGVTDSYVFLLPLIRPILACDLIGMEITAKALNQFLVSPVPRATYQKTLRQWPQFLSQAKRESVSSENEEASEMARKRSISSAIASAAADQTLLEEETVSKIAFIQPYIEAALKEIPTRSAIAWKGPAMTRRASTRRLSVRQSGVPMSMDSLLDLFSYQTLSNLPDHIVQSILVPHQKYSLFNGATEEIRAIKFDSGLVAPDMALVRAVYGVVVSQAGATRVAEEGEAPPSSATPFLGNAESASGLYSAQTSALPSAGSSPALRRGTSFVPSGGPGLVSLDQADSVSSIAEVQSTLSKIKALRIPPRSPEFGNLNQPSDGRPYSMFVEALDTSVVGEAMASQPWRPKENTVVSMMFEHTAAVNRLAVPNDQSFFVSASSDGTAKIWLTKGVERNAFPRSALTYSKQGGRLLDAAMIENSHSVATTSSNGSVHVWRVELGGGMSRQRSSQQINTAPPGANDPFQTSSRFSNLVSVSGAAVVKTIDHSEGPVMGIQHFTGDVASVLTYATQRGVVHGWDLRSAEEPFQYQIRPELGYPTALVCSPDRNWICVGTSRGYVGLWDIRYNVMCKLWRHSAGGIIHRLACTKAAGAGIGGTLGPSEGAYLFVASGKNEAAFWGIPEGGECLKCFRSVPMTSARGPMPNLPQLHDVSIPSHPLSPLQGPHVAPHRFKQPTVDEPAVRAIMGRITNSSSSSYVVTAGTDRNIRFWDLAAPSKCFTISGLEPAQPKPVYETPPSSGLRGKLFLCYDSAVPSVQATLQSQLPVREYRGLVPPVAGFKDAILDLKTIELPLRMMISGSRDGGIKLWR